MIILLNLNLLKFKNRLNERSEFASANRRVRKVRAIWELNFCSEKENRVDPPELLTLRSSSPRAVKRVEIWKLRKWRKKQGKRKYE